VALDSLAGEQVRNRRFAYSAVLFKFGWLADNPGNHFCLSVHCMACFRVNEFSLHHCPFHVVKSLGFISIYFEHIRLFAAHLKEAFVSCVEKTASRIQHAVAAAMAAANSA
jgi:hypothetical protein